MEMKDEVSAGGGKEINGMAEKNKGSFLR